MMKRTCLGFVAALLAGILVLAVNVWSAPPKFPDKPMEFVVQGVAGSSTDIFIRLLTKMLAEQKLMTVPMTVVNKSGGAGAVANNYLRTREGNPYYILHAGGTFVSAPLRDPSVPGYKDFTPIARMTIEATSCIVRADSPFKTIKDVVDRAKKSKPGEINWGQTEMGSFHHLIGTILEEVSGNKFTFVSFGGTNESTAALLGGHIQLGSLQPSAAMPMVKAGKIRILAVATEKRVSCAPDVPTFREQGFDVVLFSHRGFVGPGNIPDDAKNSLSGIFAKLSQSRQWKEYVDKQGTESAYLPADEYKKWFVSETAKWDHLMRKGGILK
jgi:putative tricarboxylic transport membrane protein